VQRLYYKVRCSKTRLNAARRRARAVRDSRTSHRYAGAAMPLPKAEKRAFEERKRRAPHRDIRHSTVAPMTRFGRKWLWDLTLNVPLQLLGDALEGAGPPLDATPQLQEKHRFDVPRMELVLARTCAALLGFEERRVRCEVLETKFQRADRQYDAVNDAPLAPASVQVVLWSQWSAGADFVKKLPSWVEAAPPRSQPRPARNYLVTCSRGALSEAAGAFRDLEDAPTDDFQDLEDVPADEGAFTYL